MAVDAGDLEHAMDGLVEEGVDDRHGQLNVTNVAGTVLCALVASGTAHSVPVAVGSHPQVVEPSLEGMTKLVEGDWRS